MLKKLISLKMLIILVFVSGSVLWARGNDEKSLMPDNLLVIPPLLEYKTASDGTREYELAIMEGTSRFFPDKSTPTLGFPDLPGRNQRRTDLPDPEPSGGRKDRPGV